MSVHYSYFPRLAISHFGIPSSAFIRFRLLVVTRDFVTFGIARVASYRVSLQSPGDVVGGTSHARAGSERQQRAEHGGDVPQPNRWLLRLQFGSDALAP